MDCHSQSFFNGFATLSLSSEYDTYRTTCSINEILMDLQIKPHLHNDGNVATFQEMMDGIKFQRRQPTATVFVCDVSGSMQSNMELMKKMLCYLVKMFNSVDELGLVTFHGEVETVFECKKLRQDRDEIIHLVNTLRADGCTNLFGGITKGLEFLHHSRCPIKNLVVLTDGYANVGPTGCLDILNALRKHTNNMNPRPQISTIGVGYTVDQDLLQSIATEYNGKLYSILSDDEISTTFGDCVGSVLSVILNEVVVTIESNCELVDASFLKCDCSKDGKKLRYVVGLLNLDETRDILFKVFEPTHDCYIKVTLEAYDIWGQTAVNHTLNGKIAWRKDGDGADECKLNPRVVLEKRRVTISTLLDMLVAAKDVLQIDAIYAKLEQEYDYLDDIANLSQDERFKKLHADLKEQLNIVFEARENVLNAPIQFVFRQLSTSLRTQKGFTYKASSLKRTVTEPAAATHIDSPMPFHVPKLARSETESVIPTFNLGKYLPVGQSTFSQPPLPPPQLKRSTSYMTPIQVDMINLFSNQ